MEFRPFSPLQMSIQLVLVIVLLGGNYLYVNWFFKKVEPAAKSATEMRLGVGIERGALGSWTVPGRNLDRYEGSKLLLHTEVFVIQMGVMVIFIAGLLLEILFLYIFFAWLYNRGSQ